MAASCGLSAVPEAKAALPIIEKMKTISNDGFAQEAKKINECHARVCKSYRDGLLAARDAGEHLEKVQQRVVVDKTKAIYFKGKGFRGWVKKYCEFDEGTAYAYILIFKYWEKVKDLSSIRQATLVIQSLRPIHPLKGKPKKASKNSWTYLAGILRKEFGEWTPEERGMLIARPDLITYFCDELRKAVQPPVFAKAA